MSEKTVLLRVRPGMTFGATGQYAPGDLVELPAGVLVAFGDKLELVEEAVPAPVVEVANDETSSPSVSKSKSKRRVKA